MDYNRDDFSEKTKQILAKRIGYFCSNPDCNRPTVGANVAPDKATSIGIAAHITGASPGGPRYDQSLTQEERSDINNGIWLCSNCSTLIDKDEERYPIDVLKRWKSKAEESSATQLRKSYFESQGYEPYLETDLIFTGGARITRGYSRKNPVKYDERK